MKKRRWSDDNKHLWPFTLSKDTYRKYGVVIDSGASEDQRGDCHVRFYLGSYTLICELPPIVSDYSVRHAATTWDAATIERLGRDWYETRFPCEYGFSFSEGNLHTYFGPQTHDSTTTKGRCFFLPWRSSRHIRRSLYDINGKHFFTDIDGCRNAWEATMAVEAACPKVRFDFADFDEQQIVATTHIEEREWRFGTGLFRWLSWFRKPQIRRSLSLEFSSEVGPEKGSWKGGTVGHSIEMEPGELHESAFKRYCEMEHRSKYRRFHIRYIGKIEPPNQNTDPQCEVGAAS